jgi:hypothetical protein
MKLIMLTACALAFLASAADAKTARPADRVLELWVVK